MSTKRLNEIIKAFDEYYGKDAYCALNYSNPFELLVATMLSAQCTDKRVNEVTNVLFKKYKTPEEYKNANIEELCEIIKPVGLYKSKGNNIIKMSRIINEEYNNEVPSDINLLTRLPGVGRKTANVVRGNIFGIPSIVVDTHVLRISNVLGIACAKEPVEMEQELMKKLPKEYWILWNLWLIRLGRSFCTARKKHCEECFLVKYCKTGLKNLSN